MEPGTCGVVEFPEVLGQLFYVLLFDIRIGGVVADIFQLIRIFLEVVQFAPFTFVEGELVIHVADHALAVGIEVVVIFAEHFFAAVR